jgi:hypothetical protein
MPSITTPPSLGQVQADHYLREQMVAPSEREARRRDFAWAEVLERQQQLATLAPGVAVAWQLTRGLKLPATPLDPVSLTPAGEAITDPLATLDHWQANPAHATGIRLGVHRDGAVGLVGLKADSWGQWRAWLREFAVDSRVRPWSDEGERGELERTGRPLGGPTLVVWTAPEGPPMKAFSAKGDAQLREGVEWWRKINTPPDRGGFLCWTASSADGRLPVLARHALGDGLQLLASDDVLPLWAATPDNWKLKQSGSIREPDPVRDIPGWLLEVFGAKWRAVA